MLRGVERIELKPGSPPSIAFVQDGARRSLSPPLIVGADGRGSTVAKQMGAKTFSDPAHHILSGLLIDGLDACPIDAQSAILAIIFSRKTERARLYAAHSLEQKSRFAGNVGVALGAGPLPQVDRFARARSY